MKRSFRLFVGLGVGASALGLAACDGGSMQPAGRVHATMSLRGGSSAAAASFASFSSVMLDEGPEGGGDGGHFAGPVPTSSVDSLIVVVSGVRIHLRGEGEDDDGTGHPGSSEPGRHGRGDHEGGGPHDGPMGPVFGGFTGNIVEHDSIDNDSTECDSVDTEHEDEGHGWFALTVSSGGRIDLMHLPTDSNGIVLASGEIPPGTYTRATFDIAEGWLWLNIPFVTPQGDTLPAGQAIPVIVPSGRIRAMVQFVVPEGGGDIPLLFDPSQTLSRIIITGNGKVIVTPVLRHHDD